MKFTPISMKIIKNMLIVITILGALNVTTLYCLKKIEHSYSDLFNRRLQIITILQDLQTDVSEQNFKYQAYLFTKKPDYLQKSLQINVRINEEVNKAMQLTILEKNKEMLKKIAADNEEYRKKNSEVSSILPTDRDEVAKLFSSLLLPVAEEMMAASQKLIQYHLSYMENGTSFNSELVNKNILVSIIIMLIDFLITLKIINYYKVKLKLSVPSVLTVKK
ncbi:CHASE3 domain-containing protein [Paenibacillus cremeus]|uniref:Chemotaxis methyl-accepting receptor HlyB-like 4HB MCP domain-containing protein n=1 Tax=Paenibacillus cremeus TaxID=2163881 RepID=A0A559K0H0_9BACL|nr:MCP four helix bundle domain-containing protein [Paenibacillus cremeus]TVY05623.1 hypothetical protein FPZ49_29035 [Paenibacillus cremeus]